jgi:glutamine amidotransferase
MQVLSTYGYEFKKTTGLNWIDGNVVKMKDKPYIVPEIGWNNLIIHSKKNKLFEKIDKKDYFYFVHSFNFKVSNKKEILASTVYNEKFTSIISKKNIVGVQFHPEKSQSSGLRLLKNFVDNFQ